MLTFTKKLGTKFFTDPKTGVPYLDTSCHHCKEELILLFDEKKKDYYCPKCKQLIFTIKEQENK